MHFVVGTRSTMIGLSATHDTMGANNNWLCRLQPAGRGAKLGTSRPIRNSYLSEVGRLVSGSS